MAYAFVQQKSNSSGSTTQANIASGNFGSSLTAGNLVWGVVFYSSASSKTITYSDANYVECGNFYDAGLDYGVRWGYSKNVSGGAYSLTATFSANVDFPAIYVAEYSGLDTSSPFTSGEIASQQQVSPGTSSNAITSGNSPTLAAQPAAVIGFTFNVLASTVPSAGTGETSRSAVWNFSSNGDSGGTFVARPEDKRVTATTAVASTFTTTAGTDTYFTLQAVFKEATAGTTVSAPAATHTYTARAPKVNARVQPAAATHSYTGRVPTIVGTLRAPAMTHTYTARAPQAKAMVRPPAATHSHTGQVPQAKARVQPAAATHSYAGQAPKTQATLPAPAATHTYTARVPTASAGNALNAPAASHSYTGRVPQVKARVQPGVATHSYTGRVPVATAGSTVQPGSATHAYQARAPQVKAQVRAAVATHSYTARTPGFVRSVHVPAASHSYTGRVPKANTRVQPGAVTHAYTARTPQLFNGALPTPAPIVLQIPGENRLLVVSAEDRRWLLSSAPRSINLH